METVREAGAVGVGWDGGRGSSATGDQKVAEGEGPAGTLAAGGFAEGRRRPAPVGVQESPKCRQGRRGAVQRPQ